MEFVSTGVKFIPPISETAAISMSSSEILPLTMLVLGGSLVGVAYALFLLDVARGKFRNL